MRKVIGQSLFAPHPSSSHVVRPADKNTPQTLKGASSRLITIPRIDEIDAVLLVSPRDSISLEAARKKADAIVSMVAKGAGRSVEWLLEVNKMDDYAIMAVSTAITLVIVETNLPRAQVRSIFKRSTSTLINAQRRVNETLNYQSEYFEIVVGLITETKRRLGLSFTIRIRYTDGTTRLL